jgi:hypothetical protein
VAGNQALVLAVVVLQFIFKKTTTTKTLVDDPFWRDHFTSDNWSVQPTIKFREENRILPKSYIRSIVKESSKGRHRGRGKVSGTGYRRVRGGVGTVPCGSSTSRMTTRPDTLAGTEGEGSSPEQGVSSIEG